MVEAGLLQQHLAGVGGGGMETMPPAEKLGYDVTLFEKSNSLGGLMKRYSTASFKWPYREYFSFLVRKFRSA